jgi:enoyl-CoA hydratase
MAVRYEPQGRHTVLVVLARPECRNAVDAETAFALADAFRRFEADADAHVAVLAGDGGTFCAGADLMAISEGRGNRLDVSGDGPMGPTRLHLSKPVIAAIEGHAVAGGLELALWCDLRVLADDAVLGVFCRRFGVPLIDGGTIRLARLIGQSRALDLVLTGRAVDAREALSMGLANRVVGKGVAVQSALELAAQIAALPQVCLRSDRRSLLEQWAMPEDEAMQREFQLGLATLASGEGVEGATRFAQGAGRHGSKG